MRSKRRSIALNAVKRLLIVVALVVSLAPAVGASAATHLSSQLLSGKNLSKQWSRYYIENQDMSSCPESIFRRPSNKSSTVAFFANRSSGTLILEDLSTATSPTKTYDALVSTTLRCSKSDHTSNKYVTFQQVRAIQVSGISDPHRAFSLSAEAGGISVSGRVVYAVKGHVAVAFAELSILPFNAGQFKSTLEKALAKILN